MEGWICIHRKIREWGWYSERNTCAVFLELLLTANYHESFFRGVKVPIGGVVTGRESLALTLGLSERNVRTALTHLKSTNEVTIKTYSKFSVITILNWNKYQSIDQQSDQQVTSNRPASDQQVTTSNKVTINKVTKERLFDEFFEKFWKVFPTTRKGSKTKAQSAWNSALTRASKETIYESAKNYASSDEVARGYAKGTVAWLNDDRWNIDYRTGTHTGSIGIGNDARSIVENIGPRTDQPPSKWQIAGKRVLDKIERGEI